MNYQFVDIAGQRFGRLIAITRTESRNHTWLWQCQCDCGQTTAVRGTDLRKGATRSCGCWRRETTKLHRTIHGAAERGKKTAEYITWRSMMQRCYDPLREAFKNYGGRGIKVCQRWHDFRNFLADMGPRPAGRYTIERVNNNGDYEPSNCIWLPKSEQSKNRRNTK